MDQYMIREKENVKWHVGKMFSGPGVGEGDLTTKL